ncbi:glycosyltransferase family 2 protein [Candidatus Saccharibacteria bacterium]|nr:glycosyltransferase family 2 protein [Candidatus Saccharibacteria bacterium]
MSVYNEEANLEQKLASLETLDYPKERIEILIGSDGSTDNTNKILEGVARSQGHKVTSKIESDRKGKPSMLNKLDAMAKGEIIIFTDARQRLDKDSIKELVSHFADKKVGSVSAELHFEEEISQAGRGMGLYWEYEKFIRKSESKLGSMLGATGALYAVRRELIPLLPADLILDDIYIPMHAVQKGFRAILDPKAKVYDRFSKSAKEEFLRKTRTLAGNFQLFLYCKWLFNPFKCIIGWQFISHKFLRLVVPFLLAAVLISSFSLSPVNNYYLIFDYAQVIFYICAVMGIFLKQKSRICDVAYMFCVLNAAAVVGLYKFITKRQEVTWERA